MNDDKTDGQTSAWGCSDFIAEMVARKYDIQIVLTIGERGAIRWGTIKDELGEVQSSLLSTRLDDLRAEEIVERTSYDEVPPRVEYSLAPRGERLYAELAKLTELDPDFTDAFVGKWAIPIVSGLGEHGPLRNKEIFQALDTNSASTLGDHLDKLRDEGLVSRTSYDEVPPRVEYSLTARGKQLYPTFQKLSTV